MAVLTPMRIGFASWAVAPATAPSANVSAVTEETSNFFIDTSLGLLQTSWLPTPRPGPSFFCGRLPGTRRRQQAHCHGDGFVYGRPPLKSAAIMARPDQGVLRNSS